jgi:ATPase family associated with various cellular activities (AAA)
MATLVILGIVGGAVFGTLFNNVAKEDYWYDFVNKYVSFPKEDTDLIDRFLVDSHPKHSEIGKKKIIGGGWIPDEGYHYYYFEPVHQRGWFFNCYIGLRKIKKTENNNVIYYYDGWIAPWNKDKIQRFADQLRIQQSNSVRTIAIDCSNMNAEKKHNVKSYKPPKGHQAVIIQRIINDWMDNDYNLKIFIHGKPGVGKTYTAYGLTKEIEKKFPKKRVFLYDNFNPSATGVNVESLVLAEATDDTPVIIVINEVDVAYRTTLKDQQFYDPRGSHTNSKTDFNNMLDTIAQKRNVIAIYTSEKSNNELLQEDDSFKSFMREGRVDLFAKMTKDNCDITASKDWVI